MAFTPVTTPTTITVSLTLSPTDVNTYYQFLVDAMGASSNANSLVVSSVKADIATQMSKAYYGVEAGMTARTLAAAVASTAPALRVFTVL